MLTNEQMNQLDMEVKQRGMGINPDVMPTQDEADNYAFTPEATVPETPMPEAYTPEPDNMAAKAAKELINFTDSVIADVKKTNIWKRYTYGKEEVLREARDISIETGIPESAILYSPQTLDNARGVYNYRRKQMELMPPGSDEVSIDLLTKAYPGLEKIINNNSEVDAAIALQNIKNVRQVNGIVDAARTGWQGGMLQHEIAKIGKKAFMEGRAITDAEFAQYEKIQKQIEDLRQTPSFVEDPFLSIVGGTAQQVPQQLRGLGTGALYGTALAATAAGATVAVAPLTGGASMAAVGTAARTGWKWGMRLGYAVDMWQDSAGQRYIEYSRFKDKDGKRVLTDEEARAYAAAAAAVETGIEFMNAGKIMDVLKGNKSAAARQIQEAVAGATDNATFTAALKRVLSGVGEIAVTESLEEGGQEAADRIMSNFVASYKGGNIPKYTPGQVLQGAVESFAEALPASIGFGLSAAGGGSIGLVRRAAAYSELQDLHVRERLKNVTGINMIQNMIQDNGIKDFLKKDTDIAKDFLHNTVEGTGYEKVNIDTQLVLEQEGGMNALQDIAQAAGMSADEIQNAVETGADITVPTEVYFQMRAENENFAIGENFISFSDTAPCFARNQYYAKMVKSELDAVMRDVDARQMEQQQAALDMIVQGNFAEGLEQDAAAAILTIRPDNPAEGWKEMRGMYKQQLDDILAPVIKELKSGMKQGVDIVRVEGERAHYERISNNAQWAREFYAENKRWPTQFELEGMAIDILSGRDFSKLMDYQNRPEMESIYEDNAAKIDELLNTIEVFDGIRDRIEAIDADELQTMEGMSREAYDVYRNVSQQLAASAPNDAVKRSAKAGAALLARRADRYAEAMRAAGNTNYTAADYFRDRFGLRVGGTFQGGGSNTLFQVPAAEFNRQKAEVRAKYEGTDQWLKSPDGSDTNLTEDQWITVRTSAFKNWFGDWEEGYESSKVLDENGEPLVVKHWTMEDVDFDTFSSEFLGDNTIDNASEPAVGATSLLGFWFNSGGDENLSSVYERDMELFLSIENPKEYASLAELAYFINIEDGADLTMEDYQRAAAELKEALQDEGYDGIVINDEEFGGKSFVAFEPNQIKDASGRNVGFDPASNNIYLQEAMPERDLVAYHNISEENLMRSAQLGGLPAPSIAVTQKDIPFTAFGGITLIGTGNMIDPTRGKNDVYSRDAWTVTFPETVYDKIKVGDIRIFRDNVKDAFNALGSYSKTKLSEILYRLESDNSRRTLQSELYYSAGMKYKFITDELGESVKIPTERVKVQDEFILKTKKVRDAIQKAGYNPTEDQLKNISDLVRPIVESYADKFTPKNKNTIVINGETYTDRGASMDGRVVENSKGEKQDAGIATAVMTLLQFNNKEQALKQLEKQAQSKVLKGMAKQAQDAIDFIKTSDVKTDDMKSEFISIYFDENGLLWNSQYASLHGQIGRYGVTEVNESKLRDILDKKINKHKAEYAAYINRQLDKLYRNPQIKIGNRKAPITLENIVAAMLKKRGAGNEESMTFNDHKALASMSKKFTSLDDIRNNKDKLRPHELADLSIEAFENEAQEFRSAVYGYYKWKDSFDTYDDANKALVDAAKHGGTEKAIRDALRRYDFVNVPEDAITKAKAALEAAKDVKTSYFEAKPMRPVMFNEFAAAVVPNGTSKETIDYLKSQGIAVTKYNPKIEGDRQAKTQKAAQKANVYFQRQQRQGETIQGATQFEDNGRRIISIFESGNESTMAHELGHVFLADLKELAEMPNAPAQIVKDWETVKKWIGWKNGQENFTTPQQEKFARGFEAYLRTGEAPATGLRKIFRQFKNWLTKIYKDFLSLGGKPSADVQAVMARMLATEQEVENAFKLREAENFEKVGGFDYLAKDSAEMYKRWQEEAQEYAKEKVLAQAMKDLTKQRSDELAALRDQMETDIRQQLQEKPLYRAQALLEQNPKLPEIWPAEALGMTYEEYTQAIAEQGPLDKAVKTAVDAAMQEVEQGLPMEKIKQAAEAAVNSSEYRGLYLTFEQDFMEKKQRRDETLNKKIEKILDELEKAAYESNIETIDPQGKIRASEPETDTPAKRKIRELKYQARWNEAEMKAINRMELAASMDELQAAVRDFKAIFKKTRQDVRVYRDTAVQKYKLIKQYAADNMAEMPISEATNVTKWAAMEKRAGRESIEAMKRAIDAELKYQPEEKGLVPTEPASEERLPAERKAKESPADLWRQANEAKLRQRVFAEYAAMAQKNKDYIRKKNARLQARSKTIAKNNNMPANERYMYNHGLYVLGLSKQDAPVPQDAMSLMEMIQGYKDNLQAFFVDEDGNISMPDYAVSAMTGNTAYNGGYQNLTMEQYQYFNDMLTAIYKAGIDANKVKSMKDINGNTVLISDVATAIVDETNARVPLIMTDDVTNAGTPTFAQSIQNKARRARVELTKPETILDMMGPTAYRYVYETVNQSWNKEQGMLEESAKMMQAIWAPYSNTEKSEMRAKKQYRFGTSILTKEKMICVAFNWGTEINRKRIMDGFGVDEMTVNELLSNLTQKDWQMVSAVWELVNSYWPETARVEESMTGIAPQKQAAMPFEITGKDGQVYKLQGGYYPIKYDPSKSLKAANQQQDDMAKQYAANNATMNRNRGFTKQRVQGTVARPVLLSFDVLNKHISDVVHNICFRESLRDVNRIIKSPEVSQTLQDHFGIDQTRALEQWVRDCWAPDVAKKDVFATGMEFFRHKQTAAALGYRMTTVMLNALNIYPMTDYLGAARTMAALGKFYSDPKANWDFCLSRSIFLRQRAQTMDRDAGEVLRKEFIGGYGTVADTLIRGERALEKHAFDALAVTDLMLANPLWMAEYQRVYQERTAELKGKMDAAAWSRIEMEAVAAGDKAVRKVFGSGEMKDLSPVQKGGEMTKAVTMFYSYFNVVFNALYSGYGEGRMQAMGTDSKIMLAPLAKKMLYWLVLTGVTEGLMRTAIDALVGDGGDDPEEWMKAMVKDVSDNIAGTIPVFRDIWSGVIDKLMGERYYGARPLPLYTVYDNIMKLSNTISSNKKSKIDVFREGARITNGMTGIGNAVTDAFATTAYWADTDFDAPLYQYLAAVFFDKRLDKKKK